MKRQTHLELLLRCPVQRCTDGETGLPGGEGPPALPRVISSFPQTHPRTQVNLGCVHEVAVFFQPTIQVLGSPGCQPCAAPSLPRGAHSLKGVVSRLGGCPASGGADEGQGTLFGRASRDGACGGVEAGDVDKALQVEALSGRSGEGQEGHGGRWGRKAGGRLGWAGPPVGGRPAGVPRETPWGEALGRTPAREGLTGRERAHLPIAQVERPRLGEEGPPEGQVGLQGLPGSPGTLSRLSPPRGLGGRSYYPFYR